MSMSIVPHCGTFQHALLAVFWKVANIFKESFFSVYHKFCFCPNFFDKFVPTMKTGSPIFPSEIWEKILDLLDTASLLNFQKVCQFWRSIVLGYIMNGRLGNRALVKHGQTPTDRCWILLDNSRRELVGFCYQALKYSFML
jgi:hypothetical protein